MEHVIRKAAPEELQPVRRFYHEVIDGLAQAVYNPGWKKDIYPSVEDLQGALARQELYVAELDGAIAGAMTVNHDCNEGYAEVTWPTAAAPEEVILIHALGVHPKHFGQGLGKAMVRFVMDLGRRNGQKALRLDVLAGNLPAEKLYTGLGFRYVDSQQMFYEDTGWTQYDLYEYVL